jgi:hypothetical protein
MKLAARKRVFATGSLRCIATGHSCVAKGSRGSTLCESSLASKEGAAGEQIRGALSLGSVAIVDSGHLSVILSRNHCVGDSSRSLAAKRSSKA